MQIKKISNDKLKVILSSHDLDEKNIDVDAFLSNSIESQDLFFEILDLAEQEYAFHIENSKAIVEAISLDNNIFVLTITKLENNFPNDAPSKEIVYFFNNIDHFLNVYSLLKEKIANSSDTYFFKWNDQYFMICNTTDSFIEELLIEYAVPIKINMFKDFLIEHGKVIKQKGTL